MTRHHTVPVRNLGLYLWPMLLTAGLSRPRLGHSHDFMVDAVRLLGAHRNHRELAWQTGDVLSCTRSCRT